MRNFEKSHKLDHVCYDIRGPIMDEANRMTENGIKVLKLNIGNPAPFNFTAPDDIHSQGLRRLFRLKGYFLGKKSNNAVLSDKGNSEC